MTGALTAAPTPATGGARLFASDALEPRKRTLEDEVVATCRELRRRGTAPCLVCGSPLDSSGRCEACGSELD